MGFGGSSGGSSSISGASDAAMNNPANGEVVMYNASLGKWQNSAVTANTVGGVTVSGTPSSGQVLMATGSTAATWQPLPSAGSGSLVGYVELDSFTGANDDAKLTAAMSYAAAQSNPPTIRLANRSHSFSTARTLYDGFRLEGPPGYSNAEKSAANMTCTVNVSVSNGVWLTSSSGSFTWDVYIGQIAFKGTSTTQFMACTNTGLYCALLRDLSFSGFKSILGSQSSKLLLSACTFDGYWETNNSYNGAFHIGGSDNTLWSNGMLLDSGTAFNSAGNAAGQFHLWCDYLEKTSIGPLYITCEGNWGGVRVTGPGYNSGGSNLGGPVWFTSGLRCEGRNAGAPCNGAAIRVEGGMAVFRDSWIAYGMDAPSSMGHSPVDAGVVHVTGGMVLLDGCTYDRTSGMAETVPFVYVGGGTARVSNQMVGSKGGTWSGLPRVKDGGGALSNDTTVTAI